jgi:hypothetical protein
LAKNSLTEISRWLAAIDWAVARRRRPVEPFEERFPFVEAALLAARFAPAAGRFFRFALTANPWFSWLLKFDARADYTGPKVVLPPDFNNMQSYDPTNLYIRQIKIHPHDRDSPRQKMGSKNPTLDPQKLPPARRTATASTCDASRTGFRRP